MTKPLIGVTGDDQTLRFSWWFIRWALWRCGARAWRLTPDRSALPPQLDGIIISGGDDIDPQLYLPDTPEVAPINPRRDQFEIAILERLLGTDMPVLGICRGAQLLNVVLGGTLYADLREVRVKTSNRRSLLPRKRMDAVPGSRLHHILGSDACRVNSLHHQAVRDLGEGLAVSGRDLDGIVQAIESTRHPFRLGVQWHPEYLPQKPIQLRLFQQLVESAR